MSAVVGYGCLWIGVSGGCLNVNTEPLCLCEAPCPPAGIQVHTWLASDEGPKEIFTVRTLEKRLALSSLTQPLRYSSRS